MLAIRPTLGALLLVTSLAACSSGGSGGDAVPQPKGAARTYATAMAKGFADGKQMPVDDPSQADCAARRWVDTIGIGIFRKKGVTPADLKDPDFHFDDLGLTRRQAEQMIDAYRDCKVEVYDEVVAGMTGLSRNDDAFSCVRKHLTDDVVRDFTIAGLTGRPPSATTNKAFDKADHACATSGG